MCSMCSMCLVRMGWGGDIYRDGFGGSSLLLVLLVLFLQLLELLRVDRRHRHVLEVVVLVQELVCVDVYAARDGQQTGQPNHVALEERLSRTDHRRRHLPCPRILVT